MSINQNFGRRRLKKSESVELEMKIKNILLDLSKIQRKKRKSKMKTLNKVSCKRNSKLHSKKKKLLLLLLRTWLSLERREEEQEIKNRMSENQKTILNIKKPKTKRKSKQFILQLANPHEHTYKKQETIYYCIVFGILLFENKKKLKKKYRNFVIM